MSTSLKLFNLNKIKKLIIAAIVESLAVTITKIFLVAVAAVFVVIFYPKSVSLQEIRSSYMASITDVNYTYEQTGHEICAPNKREVANKLEIELRRAGLEINKASRARLDVLVNAVFLKKFNLCAISFDSQIVFHTKLRVPNPKRPPLFYYTSGNVTFRIALFVFASDDFFKIKTEILNNIKHIIEELELEILRAKDSYK